MCPTFKKHKSLLFAGTWDEEMIWEVLSVPTITCIRLLTRSSVIIIHTRILDAVFPKRFTFQWNHCAKITDAIQHLQIKFRVSAFFWTNIKIDGRDAVWASMQLAPCVLPSKFIQRAISLLRSAIRQSTPEIFILECCRRICWPRVFVLAAVNSFPTTITLPFASTASSLIALCM